MIRHNKNGFIDLHTHSTCSDGTLTPTELVKKASDIGLRAIALTDHDTVGGLNEAAEAGKKYGVEIVNGIEFSVTAKTEMHLLGLDFNSDCPGIKNILNQMIENRKKRNSIIFEKLCAAGMIITEDDIRHESTSEVTGRSQIAKAMIKKGYVSSVKEAFDKYLSLGQPLYVKRDSLTPENAIKVIHSCGGKAVLAHLNQTKLNDDELLTTLKNLKAHGLDGVEGYYTEYTDEMNIKYRQMASDLGLKLSGGSDFHGENKENFNLGTGHGNLKIPYSILVKLRE